MSAEHEPTRSPPRIKTYTRNNGNKASAKTTETTNLPEESLEDSASRSSKEDDHTPIAVEKLAVPVSSELPRLNHEDLNFNPYEVASAPQDSQPGEGLIIDTSSDAPEAPKRLRKKAAPPIAADAQADSGEPQAEPTGESRGTEEPEDAPPTAESAEKDGDEWFSDLELPAGGEAVSVAAKLAAAAARRKKAAPQPKPPTAHYEDPEENDPDDIHKDTFRILRQTELRLPHKTQQTSPAEFYIQSKDFYADIRAKKSSVLVDPNEQVRLTADHLDSQATPSQAIKTQPPLPPSNNSTPQSRGGGGPGADVAPAPRVYPEDSEIVLVVLPPEPTLPQPSLDSEHSDAAASSSRSAAKPTPQLQSQTDTPADSSLFLRMTPSMDPNGVTVGEPEENAEARDEEEAEDSSSSTSDRRVTIDDEDERAVLRVPSRKQRIEDDESDGESDNLEEAVKEQILKQLEDRRARAAIVPELADKLNEADEDLLGDQEKAASSEEEGEDLIERADEDDSAAEAAAAQADLPDSDDERAVVADTAKTGGKDEKATKLHQRWRHAAEAALEQHITDNVMARQREEEAARLSRMRRLTKRLLRQKGGESDSGGEYSEGGTRYDAPEPGEATADLPMTEEMLKAKVQEERRKRRRVTGALPQIGSLQEDPNAQEILSMISEKKTTVGSLPTPLTASTVSLTGSAGANAASMYSRQSTTSFLAQHSGRKLEQLVTSNAKRTSSLVMSGRAFVFTTDASAEKEKDADSTPSSSAASAEAEDSKRMKRSASSSLRNSSLHHSSTANTPLSLSSSSSLLSALNQDSRLPG